MNLAAKSFDLFSFFIRRHFSFYNILTISLDKRRSFFSRIFHSGGRERGTNECNFLPCTANRKKLSVAYFENFYFLMCLIPSEFFLLYLWPDALHKCMPVETQHQSFENN